MTPNADTDRARTTHDDYRGASAAAIRHHYDVGNAFFALWLDPTLTYSCALWEDDADTLLAAQERKLDFLATRAGAPRAGRVLDVGCGWGSMLRRLVDHHGVGAAVGVTLSAAQAEWVAALGDPRIEARCENWADHDPRARYEAIVVSEGFEHFADHGLRRADRIAGYQAFFRRCATWLPSGGRLGLQTCVKGGNVRLDRETVREQLFIVERVFPESELPWCSEILEASERRFDLVSARSDAGDYARTCSVWRARLDAVRDRAEALAGPELVADFDRYLRAAARGFDNRHLGLVRLVFERV